MATMGSGDVLTGMIASFVAQGSSTLQASIAATMMHGIAGSIAAGIFSSYSLIASDIIEAIAEAFMQVLGNEDELPW